LELFRNARLQGFVPPLAAAPVFNLRKPPAVVYTLDQYVEAGILAPRHPGGCATVHANDPLSALHRLDRLAQRAGVGPQPDLVADAIQLIVMIAGGARGRRVTDLVEVAGRAAGAYRLDPLPAC